MVVSTSLPHVAILGVSAGVTGALGVYAWRHRMEPGSRPFAGLMFALTVWTASYAVALTTHHPRWRLIVENVQWFGIVFVPVFYLVFALEYTGYGELANRRALAILSVHPLVTLVLVWTNGVHHLVWTDTRVVVVDGIAVAVQQFGPWFWTNLLYTYVLLSVGSLLLLRLIFFSEYLFVDQSVLLLVGVTVPVAANLASIFGSTPYPGIDLVPYALTVTGVAFGLATFRHRLFELLPATRQLGRDAAIRHLEDGVVIVDDQHQVLYVNPTAADIIECEPEEVVGRPAESVLSTSDLAFDVEDALAELDLDGATFEVRSSPVRDQHGRQLGHTLILTDITGRKRRERELERRHDELQRLDRINEVIRGINRALVGATTRAEIERAVCEQLVRSDHYTTAMIGRGMGGHGADEEIRWAVVAETHTDTDDGVSVQTVSDPSDGQTDTDGNELESLDADRYPTTVEEPHGQWTAVPLVYERTVHGVLGLVSDRPDAFTERELDILGELGETVGLAISAVERRRLLLSDVVVELELVCTDENAAFVAASGTLDARLTLEGLVPTSEGQLLTYWSVQEESPGDVTEVLAGQRGVTGARAIDDRDEDGILECTVAEGSVLMVLADRAVNITDIHADGGECHIGLEVAPDLEIREFLEQVEREFPATRLAAKRERDRPIRDARSFPGEVAGDLTERQREVVETAHLAGYFEWPRESTGEEVAESMDVSAPTFYKHLRNAQNRILAELLDEELNGEI